MNEKQEFQVKVQERSNEKDYWIRIDNMFIVVLQKS